MNIAHNLKIKFVMDIVTYFDPAKTWLHKRNARRNLEDSL